MSNVQDRRRGDSLLEEIHRLAMLRSSGSISADEENRLDELVREDPRARAVFVEYILQTASLRDWARAESDLASAAEAEQSKPPVDYARPTPTSTLRQLHPQQHPWRFAAVVLSLTIAAWGAFYLLTMPRPRQFPVVEQPAVEIDFVAQLTGAQDAAWPPNSMGRALGSHFSNAQELELLEGLVEITYRNGVRIVVEGPVKLTLTGPDRVDLHSGKASVLVPSAARGFAVSTPAARVVDLGTEFGLFVERDGACDVHVFAGRVIVEPARDAAHRELATGESIRIAASGSFAGRAGAPRYVRGLPASARRRDGDVIAYQVLPGIDGTQNFSGSLGHDFVVNLPIEVTRLGVFDSGADGLARTLTAELWRRGGAAGPEKLIEMAFTAEDSGELDGGSRFKPLKEPLLLPPGEYTMVAHGYGPDELAYNTGIDPVLKRRKAVNSGGGAISFLGDSRFGEAGQFPVHADSGDDPARYGAGTFAFRIVTAE